VVLKVVPVPTEVDRVVSKIVVLEVTVVALVDAVVLNTVRNAVVVLT
jgi:hypothetical protein